MIKEVVLVLAIIAIVAGVLSAAAFVWVAIWGTGLRITERKGIGRKIGTWLESLRPHIDPELYEAALADGAGRWARFWHVTLPGIRPIVGLPLIGLLVTPFVLRRVSPVRDVDAGKADYRGGIDPVTYSPTAPVEAPSAAERRLSKFLSSNGSHFGTAGDDCSNHSVTVERRTAQFPEPAGRTPADGSPNRGTGEALAERDRHTTESPALEPEGPEAAKLTIDDRDCTVMSMKFNAAVFYDIENLLGGYGFPIELPHRPGRTGVGMGETW